MIGDEDAPPASAIPPPLLYSLLYGDGGVAGLLKSFSRLLLLLPPPNPFVNMSSVSRRERSVRSTPRKKKKKIPGRGASSASGSYSSPWGVLSEDYALWLVAASMEEERAIFLL